MMLSFALLLVSIAAAPGAAIKAGAATHELARFELRGTVRDRQGAVIPGATVVAIAGESKASVVTDGNGVFRFSLPAGTYRITVTASKYAAVIRENVAVGAGQTSSLAFVLGTHATAKKAVPKDHVGAEPPPIPIAPPPPPVILEERIETAPPPPPPAPPSPPPATGNTGAEAPPPAAADGHPVAAADGHPAPSALYWNEWLEGEGQKRLPWVPVPPPGVASSTLPSTDLYIDLSLADLSRLDGANVTSSASTSEMVSALAGETKVRVLPVVLGDALMLDSPGWRPLPINFDKMRTTSVRLPATSSIDDATFRNLARTASVLEKSDWKPIVLQVHGVTKGCAAVALSVWDANLRRPLDQQYFPVAVGPVKCGQMRGGPGLSTALLRRYGSTGDYDAALHVFEMMMPRTKDLVTSAVFVAREDPRPRVWKVGYPLSALSKAIAPDLGLARASQPYAVEMASRTLITELFPDDPDAQAALAALKRLRSTPGKTIYARIVTESGTNLPLPLGLIDVGGGVPLGSVATVATPFPIDTDGNSSAACIDQRVMVSDSPNFTGMKPRPSGDPLVGYPKARDYFGGKTSDRVALVLLGHHGETEQLVFDPLTPKIPMTPNFLTRRFDHGVGFFMVCGLAAPSAVPTTWLQRFGDHGIDAAIASPFEIEADTAEQFLTAVQEVLAATPAASSISLAELYAAAIKRMAPEKRYEAFEYVVIGDGSIRLCGEGS